MKLTKRFTCVVLVIILLLTLIFSTQTIFAKGTSSYEIGAEDYGLQDNCQDGMILHAWNASYNNIKSHLKEIAQAGFTTVQTSPVQQPKDYNGSYRDIDGQWWKLYQPLSFSIAPGGSWLGSKSELASLCTEAHKYKIKVICDIVANHTANNGNNNECDWNLQNYESQLYNNKNKYFHPYTDCNDSSIKNVVYGNIGEPDLNTGDSYVQQRVLSLLKECVDCGVDGFRFDAAKHIETPDDGDCKSDFWPTVLNGATNYAKSKSNKSLYYYGEILNTVGNGRSYSSYTKYMSVIDNKTGNNRTSNVNNNNASSVANDRYESGASANKIVLWAESHDTYADNSSKNYNQTVLDKSYCFSAALKDSTVLYFCRPAGDMGSFNSSTYKSAHVSAVNKFHNHFVGAEQSTSSSGSLAICERFSGSDTGVVIVNCNGNNSSLSNVSVPKMANGTYKDVVTGKSVTVSNGKITSGEIGSSGVAVIFNDVPVNKPLNTISQEGGNFDTDTLTLTLGLINAKSGTYQIGNGKTTTYTSSTKITIGNDMGYDESVTIHLTATDGNKTNSVQYTFKKIDPTATPFKFPTPRTIYLLDTKKWGLANCYAWIDDNNKNAQWPGIRMTSAGEFDGYKVYSYDVPSQMNNIIFNNDSQQTDNLNFQQYSYYDNDKATWVFVGQPVTQPTTTPTKPTTRPTTKPTEITEIVEKLFLGDCDLNAKVEVIDVTKLQQFLARIISFDTNQKKCADVNQDNKVEIIDATYIQQYLAKMVVPYKIGQEIGDEELTQKPTYIPTVPTETKVKSINRIYVDMGSQGEVYAYYWQNNQSGPYEYPGVKMIHISGTIYAVDVDVKYDYIIFNVGNNKTPDLQIPGNNYIYSRQNGKWNKYNPDVTSPTSSQELDFSNPKKIYVINDGNWSSIYAHYWGSSETSWPGNLMTNEGTYKGYDLYSYIFPENTVGFVINRSNEQSQDYFFTNSYRNKVFSTKNKNFIDA